MVDCPVVETNLGKVKGRLLSKPPSGKQVCNYTGLPFAKPPVGDLRFEPPCEVEPWSGILDGTVDPPMPYQEQEEVEKFLKYMLISKEVGTEKITMSEDCLYLSVYTTNPSPSANLPVLFGIYGGGFLMGTQNFYNGNVLSSLNDVVVVVPNYRLGVFGFLSMGKESICPGNMGLLDQIMALKWTRDHIRNFGGNPDNVTIFGESAGGISVNCHMYSPLSRGLFHRAFSSSGSINIPAFPFETIASTYKEMLKELNIKQSNEKDILKHLKKVEADEYIKIGKKLFLKMMYFAPVVDGKFLPESSSKLVEDGNFAQVPYLLGCNNSEGYGIMNIMLLPGFDAGISEQECMGMLKGFIGNVFYKGLPDSAYDAIIKEYLKGVADDKYKWSKVYGAALSDVMFIVPAYKSAMAHAKKESPTYLYHMTQALRFAHDSEYGPDSARKAPFCECDHGDELIFTLGMPIDEGKMSIEVKFTQEEKDLSREWMKYLANFAKNGNPNEGVPVQVKWPLYTRERQEFLSVQQPCSVMESLRRDRIRFWIEEIEPLLNSADKQTSL